MKRIHFSILIASILLIASCNRHISGQSATTLNQTETDASGNINLVGKSSRERLEQAPFNSWFSKNYAEYAIDSTTANAIKAHIKNKRFVIYMGTWCGDSRHEVPRMYKLLDYCGVDPSQIELITLSNSASAYKQSPGHEEKGQYIFRVPDLLVYEGKSEAGRIIESPVTSWEKDLLAITRKDTYTPQYSGAALLADLFHTTAFNKLELDSTALIARLKPITASRGQLHSFGNLLMSSGDTARAIFAYQINTRLFPADPVAWTTLASASIKTGNKAVAKACCQTAIGLQPDNKEAAAMLEQLGHQ